MLEGSLRGRVERPVSVVDLSHSGCLVRCAAALEPGSIHDLRVRLTRASLEAKVRVTETSLDGTTPEEEERRHLVGLEFLGLPARDEALLREFLEERRRAGGPPSS
jgi:c-di-GMP-binding flagellar brake protein YcgR